MNDKPLTVGQIHQLSVDANPEIERLHKVIAEYSEKYSAGLSALSELASLRSQVAELQRQLDEQAKQEPVGAIEPNGRVSIWLSHFAQHPWSERFKPLYRLPPNLPAMIEKARTEERGLWKKYARHHTACFKINFFESNDECTCGLDAIRARGEKI